jgi:hypothetical protein
LSVTLRQGYGLPYHRFDNNTYFNPRLDLSQPLMVRQEDNTVRYYSFTQWQLAGNDAHSTFTYGMPRGTKVFVRANRFETGRANIAIFNWSLLDQVSVDLSGSGLPIGARYEIRDAENFLGPALVTGTYGGTAVSIPMKNLVAGLPIGNAGFSTPHTPAEFGTFVLIAL